MGECRVESFKAARAKTLVGLDKGGLFDGVGVQVFWRWVECVMIGAALSGASWTYMINTSDILA